MTPQTVIYRLLVARFPLTVFIAGKAWTLSLGKLAPANCWRAQLSCGDEMFFVDAGYTESDLERRLTVTGVSIVVDSASGEIFRRLESRGLAEKLA